MKTILKAYLPHIVGLTLIALLVFAGWQWVTGLGYRAQAAALRMQLLECQGDLAVQTANTATLKGQIQRQNDAVDAAASEAARVRADALRARDAALVALRGAQDDYARLREDWPQDCVSAVDRVREALGL
ncbi:hypothetical protein [Haliea salexigens]|uniref:hypothetical protein n=1 Tax=Haliea salexigens TaxID=287487 RepID=UPI000422EAD6|nr:hypothetical protein [Haliea salexigens]